MVAHIENWTSVRRAKTGLETADLYAFLTTELKQPIGASSTRIRNAMLRIARVLGPVELPEKRRRTQRPSPKGRNIGGAAVVANTLIELARDPATDQEPLRHEIRQFVEHLERRRRRNEFRKSTARQLF